MRQGFRYVAWVLGAGLAAAGATALANRGGAQPGFNGGRAGSGRTCAVCHGFNLGTGRVELLGAPVRYVAGTSYDLTVRVTAPEEDGSGFELSAEGLGGHEGALTITDAAYTRFADGTTDYVTHTGSGVDDSEANWVVGGGSYDYHVRWTAPAEDAGPVTFFAAANAVRANMFFSGVRYYAGYRTAQFASPGDADGDGDLDLFDFAAYQICLGDGVTPPVGDCVFADADGDGFVALSDMAVFSSVMAGATATAPAEYVLADASRGGRLYDKWWLEIGAPAPSGEHPLYPPTSLTVGSSTHRCKECHGWDYKGRDGAYGSGSHFTGIAGVQGTTLTPQTLFDFLKADSNPQTGGAGHDMDALGLSDGDIWDIVKMTLEGVVETDDYIPRRCVGGLNDGLICIEAGECPGGACDPAPIFTGDADSSGYFSYGDNCAQCHGNRGDAINFGSVADPEYVGTVAFDNPWEFLHKVRFGHPGMPMPAFELIGWPLQRIADVGAYSATLRR